MPPSRKSWTTKRTARASNWIPTWMPTTCKRIADAYKARVQKELGKPFPEDVQEQLWGAIGAVFGSVAFSPRANTYRKLNNIPEDWGTAVTVQAMVFGNRGETSATGVAFTRDPATGEKLLYGEFLINAQGEDVVAGIRTPQPISKVVRERQGGKKPSMEEAMPKAYAELKAIGERLEQHYRDMQDVEFTVQEGKLFMLQTRAGKRTAEAALKAAVDMVARRADRPASIAITPRRARSAEPAAASHARSRCAARADRGGPGRVARRRHRRSRLHGGGSREAGGRSQRASSWCAPKPARKTFTACMRRAGILTARGGMTSHAAVVARGMGRPCVSGAGMLKIDAVRGEMVAGNVTHQARRHHHHRRRRRPGVQGRGRDAPAGTDRRFRHPDGLGRRSAPPESAHQCRHAGRCRHGAQVRRRRHRPVPHRAHVLRAPTASSRCAR